MTRKILLTLAILAMGAVLWGASITVTSPNSDPRCSTDTLLIAWTSSGVTQNVTIALRFAGSAPDAAPAAVIASNIPNSGSFSWPLPGPAVAPGDYFVRVRTEDATVRGDGPVFTIYNVPTILVKSPNGGTWTKGHTYTIQWKKACAMQNSVTIALRFAGSAPDAAPALVIATGEPNDESYPSWTIPNDGSIATGDYSIRVRTDDATVRGDSAIFHIGSGGGVEPECSSFIEKLKSIRHVDVRMPFYSIPPPPNFCYCPKFYVSEISRILAQARKCFPPRAELRFVLVKNVLLQNDLVVAQIGTYGPAAVPETLTTTLSRTEFFAMRSHIENYKLGIAAKVQPPIGFPDQRPKDVMIKFALKLLPNFLTQPGQIEVPK